MRSGLNGVRAAIGPIGGILARFSGNRPLLIAGTRIGLIAAAGLATLYLRSHYIEEGRVLGRQTAYVQGLARGKQLAACPKAIQPKASANGRAQHQR